MEIGKTLAGETNLSRQLNFELLFLTLILLLGLYLRLFTVSATQIDTPFRADARQYTAYAYNLRLHGVYSSNIETVKNTTIAPKPDAFRSPGYPVFLYPFTLTKRLDRFAINVFYVQAILSALTIAIVYFLGRTLIGATGAIIVATLTAISPHLINLNVYLLTETLFTFVIVLGIALIVSALKTNKDFEWMLAGFTLAFAALIKPTVQYYVIFLILFIFMFSGMDRKIKTSLLVVLPFFTVFSIWLVRNLLSLGYLSDPALTINTLHHGMYPQFMYNGQVHSFGFPYRFDPNSATISSSLHNVITEIARRFHTHPTEHLIWYLSKPLYFFRWEMIQGSGTFIYPVLDSPYGSSSLFIFINGLMRMIHPILIALSFFGAVIAWLPKHRLSMDHSHSLTARLLSLTYGYFILVHIVGAPFPRYSVPIRPITYILAILPIYIAVTVIRKKRSASRLALGV
ncbi:glycosyltransferase family 39 protein [uncultured Desulfosarcina sp.]|uniref:ArnT family glycosyltransferase n=1 Tax=uncultured Desulfosarcina sp. TaxID=218289 RepID=UPI0029C84319|nr:glycosyltransferase family 39 protein [uncultured Desulfosarcina sp.]